MDRLFTRALIVLGISLLFSCTNTSSPDNRSEDGNKPGGSLTINLTGKYFNNTQSRTLAADFGSAVAKWNITLTRENYADISKDFNSAEQSFSIDNIFPGEWNIKVTGYNSSDNPAAGGSKLHDIGTSGGSIEIPIDFYKSAGGKGGFKLTIKFPSSTGIDNIAAVFREENITPSITGDDSYKTAVIQKYDIDSGSYPLFITFKKGDNNAGTFVEAINIWDNVISDKLINAGGNFKEELEFTDSDFFSSNASLSALTITNVLEGT